jgi:L-iditol 2-dehydrogenase
MADYFLVPRLNLERDTLLLPDHVGWEAAALIEPTACVIKSLRRARLKPGERVFVLGLGIMGQLHVVLARRFGAREVFASDFVEWRRERAVELGADEAYDPATEDPADRLARRTGGEMADVVIVGPGTSEAVRGGVKLAGPGGRVILFTATPPEERTELSLFEIYFREIRLLPSYSCGPRDTREALRRIASGEVPVERLVTHRFSLEDVAQAYRVAADPERSLKTLVVFPET